MGGSSTTKQNSTTNSSGNIVQTPTNPTWVTDATQALQGRINNLLTVNPQSLVAAPSALQQQAYANAGASLGGSGAAPPSGYPTATPAPLLNPPGPVMQPAPTPPAPPSVAIPQIGANGMTSPANLGLLGPTPLAPMPGAAPPSPAAQSAAPSAQGPLNTAPTGADDAVWQAYAQANPDIAAAGWLTDHPPQSVGDVNGDGVVDTNDSYAAHYQAYGANEGRPLAAASPSAPAPTPGVSPLAAGNQAAQSAVTGLLGAGPAQASAGSLLDTNLDRYANPELNGVVRSALSDYDANSGQQLAQLALQNAHDQKFSGSGSAITQALTRGELARGRAATDAGLRSNAYDTAANLAEQDLGRQAQVGMFNAGQANSVPLQAAGLLGNLSSQGQADNRADIGLLSDLGTQQQATAQNQLLANPNLLKIISGLNAQQPYDLFHGQNVDSANNSTTNSTTKQSSSDPLGEAGNAVEVAAMLFSDKRLKTDIKTVGKDKKGLPVVSYRYKGEPKGVERIGYLAQDVEKKVPQAVRTGPGGYKMVDYGLLGMA